MINKIVLSIFAMWLVAFAWVIGTRNSKLDCEHMFTGWQKNGACVDGTGYHVKR